MHLLKELIDKYDINKEFNLNHNNIELPLEDLHSNIFIEIIFNRKKNISKIDFIYRAYGCNDDEDSNIRYIGNAFDNLYFILSKIYEKHNLLLKYQVNYYDSECYGCYDPNDGIEVIINIEPILSILNDSQILSFINFLSTFYYDIPMYGHEVNCNIWKETIYPLKTKNLTFHKKAKNIKYFFEIIKALNSSSITIYNSNIAFERILSKIQTDSKIGLIKLEKTKKIGYSAKPYIDTLQNLNILQTVNDRYILDKTSKWFLELEAYLKNENYLIEDKQFHLLEKYYFLKKTLTIDFQYIYELFEIIYILEKATLNEVSQLFQEKHQEYINLDYIKGLVSLRIHWLKSLGLLENKKEIEFSANGLIFFDEIMKMRTLYLTIPTSMNAFLLLSFTKSFSKLINIKANREKNLDILIKKYIHIVMKLHINKFNKRTIISSVINSIIILSLLEKNCVAEYEDIKDIITNSNILKELGYSFVYSNKEQDGYIKRI